LPNSVLVTTGKLPVEGSVDTLQELILAKQLLVVALVQPRQPNQSTGKMINIFALLPSAKHMF